MKYDMFVQSLKNQCLVAVKYYSCLTLIDLNQACLPKTLLDSMNRMRKCCFSFDSETASSNFHYECLEKAKLNQLSCCSGNYFCTAVWNDHYKCAKRIALQFNVDGYIESIINQSNVCATPKIFIETRAVIKYLLEKNYSFSSATLVWVASECDFETLEWLVRWGCKPTSVVFNVVLSDVVSSGPVDYVSVSPVDYCSRMSDEMLDPSVSFSKQCMRKSNANCLEVLLQFEPPTKKMAKRAIVSDNLQCLVVLKRRGCPFPSDAIDIAIVWDSLDCLEYLLCQYDVDNSVLALAIEKRSFRCAKLLFLRGYCCDLALYYCVKFRCFQLLKFFTENGCNLGGLEVLIDDCQFLKTAFAVNCLKLPGLDREKVENFFDSGYFEQYKINQQLAFCGNGENIDIFELLS